jgi:hypothetical protein
VTTLGENPAGHIIESATISRTSNRHRSDENLAVCVESLQPQSR